MQPDKPAAKISEATGFDGSIRAAGGFGSRFGSLVALSLKPNLVVVLLRATESEQQGELKIGCKWDLGKRTSNRNELDRIGEKM